LTSAVHEDSTLNANSAQKKSPLEGSGLNLFSWKRIEETGRIMLHCNSDCQFIFLMTVIDVAYGWCIRARDAHLLGASEKMFYHGICHETIHGFAAREAGSGPCALHATAGRGRDPMPGLSELAVPGYHELDARGGRHAWRAARPLAAWPLHFGDGHAWPGEPGARQAFERIDNERDLQT
jgi:hypothetical protein